MHVRADEHDEKKHEQRRKQAKYTARVKRSQLDASAFALLFEKKRGDQEPREDEEDVDAEEAAASELASAADDVEVKRHDGDDRHRTNAVQRWPAAKPEDLPVALTSASHPPVRSV